jgi:hypothetical protein
MASCNKCDIDSNRITMVYCGEDYVGAFCDVCVDNIVNELKISEKFNGQVRLLDMKEEKFMEE